LNSARCGSRNRLTIMVRDVSHTVTDQEIVGAMMGIAGSIAS
jgi:hypothetical protein